MNKHMLARSRRVRPGRTHGVGGRIPRRKPPSSSADIEKSAAIWEVLVPEGTTWDWKKKRVGLKGRVDGSCVCQKGRHIHGTAGRIHECKNGDWVTRTGDPDVPSRDEHIGDGLCVSVDGPCAGKYCDVKYRCVS